MASSDQAPEAQDATTDQHPDDENTPLLSRHNGTGSGRDLLTRGRHSGRIIIVVCASASLIIAVIAILAVFGVYRTHGTTSAELCVTPACVHAASHFLYSLSPNYRNIDPCTDFEAYVCDGWRERRSIPQGQGMASMFHEITANIETVSRAILEGAYVPSPVDDSAVFIDRQNFNKMQRAYNACMAFSEIQKAGAAPLEASLQDLAKTFNSSSSGEPSTWGETYLWLQRNGITPLMAVRADADPKSRDTRAIFVGPATSLGLPSKRYYEDQSVVSAYQDAMAQVLAALKPTAKDAARHAADIVEFEVKVAAISPEIEDADDPVKSYNPISLKDATSLVPQFGLDYVLKSLAPSNYTIERVIMPFPWYFRNLSAIIDSTPDETLRQYFLWRLIVSRSAIVEGPETRPYIRFSRKLAGTDPETATERHNTCVYHIDRTLGWMSSWFFIGRTSSSSPKSKELSNQIISDIKQVFIEGFQRLDWMDDLVKELAAEKVRKVVQRIMYPDSSPNITDPKSLQDYYADLNISDAYYDNHVSSVRHEARKPWSKLGKPIDWAEWPGRTALIVDAGYSPSGNQITFPLGVMQPPWFDHDLPGYVNYGAFGATAGHELSHGFDPAGRMYDANGSLSEDLWTDRTSREFDERARCFVSQYSNFSWIAPDGKVLHVDGQRTVDDNVADAGGLSAAWSAWQKHKQRQRQANHPDKHLPGLEGFTQEQLFFISFGNSWCGKYTPEAQVQQFLTDSHSPVGFRITGAAMMNSRGFRQAFNCPVKEPVCELW